MPPSINGWKTTQKEQKRKKKRKEKLKSFLFSLFIFAYSVVKELLSGCLWTTTGLSAAVLYLIPMGRQRQWPE